MNPARARWGAIGCADGGTPSISSISIPLGARSSPTGARDRSRSARAIARAILDRCGSASATSSTLTARLSVIIVTEEWAML